MFSILKNLFRKETLKQDDIDSWLDNKITTLKKDLKQQLDSTNEQIKAAMENTKQKLQALEQAGLINPDIPERAKHFMKGNREEYTRRINNFLQSIFLPEDLEKFEVFETQIKESLGELIQGIQRPQTILNEFLASETKETNKAISSIEEAVANYSKKLQESRYFEFIEAKDAINQAKEAQKGLEALQKEISEVEKAVKDTEDKSRKLQEEIDLLKKSKSLTELQEKQQLLAEKKKALEQSLRQKFSTVETALRKYSHIAVNNKELCMAYLNDPVAAVTKDLHFSILELFYDVRKAIERDVLALKDKKKEKTLDEINSIDKEYLGVFLADYGRINKEQKELANEISKLDVTTLMKMKKDKIIANTEAVIQQQAALKKLLKEKQKIEEKDLKQELRKLEKLTGIKIV